MKRTFAALGVAALLGSGIALAAAAPASATETPETQYVLVLWEHPAGQDGLFPQTYVQHETTTKNTDEAAKAYLEKGTKCGTFYQSDIYLDDDRTAALIAKKVLEGGDESFPAEAHAVTKTTDPCPEPTPEPVLVTPLPPQFVDVCGVDKDKVQVPDKTAQVTYTVDDQRKDGVGAVTVTATASKGFVFAKGDKDTTDTLTWVGNFTNEKCAVTPPPTTETPKPTPTPEPTHPVTPKPTPTETPKPVETPKPTPTVTAEPKPTQTPAVVVPVKHDSNGPTTGTLAYTGSEGMGVGIAATLALLLAGSGLLVARRRKA